MEAFEKDLNLQLRKLNADYEDLISGSILKNLKVKSLSRDAFRNYMKSQGKLGGQNIVPRFSNDRKLADALLHYLKF